jgi:Luciferase
MSKEQGPREAVIRAISSWEGVTVHEHRMGGVEFRLGRRELGHLHARIADLPFPRRFRDELIATGQARPHHVLPESGWVTVVMQTAMEAENVIALFRRNYERAAGAHSEGRGSSSNAGEPPNPLEVDTVVQPVPKLVPP